TDTRDAGNFFFDDGKQVAGQRFVGNKQVLRHKVLKQKLYSVVTEALAVQRRATLERAHRTDIMQARQEAAHYQQAIKIIQLWRMATATRKQGKTKTPKLEQRLARCILQRCHHRQLGVHQLGDKLVLFKNLRIRPARRAIELGHQWRVILDTHLVRSEEHTSELQSRENLVC